MNDSLTQMLEKKGKLVLSGAAAVLAVLTLFLLVKTFDALATFGKGDMPYMNTITVEGTGEATAIPDTAMIGYSVTETGATVGEAQTKATEKMNAALAFLKDAGVEEKDTKTTSYNVYPEYEYQQPCYYGTCPVQSNPRIIGYQVSQSIEVKVRDTEKAGEILQGLGDVGVQNIYGPNFTVDDEDATREEARSEAIAEARAKAKRLAKELGVGLGKVVSFYENTGGYPYYGEGYGGAMDASMTKEAPAPNLPVGENETSVSVSITYEIH